MIYTKFEDIPFNYELPYKVELNLSECSKYLFNKYKSFIEDYYSQESIRKYYAGCLYPKRKLFIQFPNKDMRDRYIEVITSNTICYDVVQEGNMKLIKVKDITNKQNG
jgi:hypothetical protein